MPRRPPDLPKTKITRDSLRETAQLMRYILPYRGQFFAGIACLVAGSAMGLSFPMLAGGLVDSSLHGGTAAVPLLGVFTINQIALVMACTVTVQALAAAGSAQAFNRVGQSALADLRSDTYGWLIGLPMTFFAQRRVGELTSRMSADIAQIEGAFTMALPQLCRQLLMFIGGISLLISTSGRLTLVMLATVPILVGGAVVFSRKMRTVSRETQDRLAETNTIVEETLQSIASVKAFANEVFEVGRFQKANAAARNTALGAAFWRALFFASFIFALFGGLVIVMWYGAQLVVSQRISPGELTRFVLYSTFVAGALGQAAELFSQVQRTVGATQRVRELFREKRESTPLPAKPGAAPAAAPEIARVRGAVTFEHVSFRYPSRKEVAVLKDVSLEARPGEVVALVGRSGAGKSTLTALLLRFYDPDQGRVLVDGRDAREYDLTALRSQMALVPQDVLLFGGTIMENIAYGRPGASEAEVRAAAQQANAAEFIEKFPEGYATIVGDRGIKLSGGQRQRIAIARAILKDPAILILDEATSSLDSESEKLVQGALETLMRGRTTFVVAHRLATIRQANQIAVLDEGRIAEIGTHDELTAQPDGLYKRLSSLQFHGVLQA